MKKRAIVSTLASLALAGAMCVGFAACGSESAESVKGEEVTKETWEAFFKEDNEDFKNFKLTKTEKMISEAASAKMTVETTRELTYQEGKSYGKQKAKVSFSGDVPDASKTLAEKQYKKEYEWYANTTAEGETVYYGMKDGAWAKVDEVGENYNYETGLELLYEATGGAPEFDSFVYNAEKKGYVLKSWEAGDDVFVIKFKGGKVKAVWEESTLTSIGGTLKETNSYIITYGGQSVTLPTV